MTGAGVQLTVLSALLLFLKEFFLGIRRKLPHLHLLVDSRRGMSGSRVFFTEQHAARSRQPVALRAADSPFSEIWGEESEG